MTGQSVSWEPVLLYLRHLREVVVSSVKYRGVSSVRDVVSVSDVVLCLCCILDFELNRVDYFRS